MGSYFNKGVQTSESFLLGSILALGGGYLDTYTFLEEEKSLLMLKQVIWY